SALLEEIYEFPIAARDLGGRLLVRRLAGVPGDQGIPENSAADCEADEAWHRGRHAEPFADFAVVLAAAEHDATDMVASASPRREVIGEALQSPDLPLVQRAVALRIVAHQDLAEGRVEGLDMAGEILTILKVELLLAALLRRTGGGGALGGRVAQDRGAELLVDEDAGLGGGRAAGQRPPGAAINDLPGGGHFG